MEQTGWKLVHGDVFRPPPHTFWFVRWWWLGGRCWLRVCAVPADRPALSSQTQVLRAGWQRLAAVLDGAGDHCLLDVWHALSRQPRQPHDRHCAALHVHGVGKGCLLVLLPCNPYQSPAPLHAASWRAFTEAACTRRLADRTGRRPQRPLRSSIQALSLAPASSSTFSSGAASPRARWVAPRCSSHHLVVFFLTSPHLQIPFGTMVALLVLWLGISTPLVFGGYYFGYRMEPYKSPVKTNQIPRQIPEQMWYMHPLVSMMLGGILPFGAVFIELFFILTVGWGRVGGVDVPVFVLKPFPLPPTFLRPSGRTRCTTSSASCSWCLSS